MARTGLIALAALSIAIMAAPGAAEDIRGDWHTDPESALAAAAKAKKPVLAVAMDHA